MESIVQAEYMMIFGIFLMTINLLTSLVKFFFRIDALYRSGKKKFILNIVTVLAEVAYITVSIVFFKNEDFVKKYALALLAVSITFTIVFYWALVQLKGVSLVSMEILERLVGVIEAGDENLDGHSLHVQNLTMLIYDYLPLSARAKINPMNLQYASLFLDIGKLGIPRNIIHKKGKLLPEERELIQKHPEICVEIFESLPCLNQVTFWIKYHHERVDGNGYYHLKGDEIPLPSRILAIADTYSAITMDRSYRPSLTHESAISELRLVAGKQLDAQLVELFCAIPKATIAVCMEDVRNRMKKYQAGTFR
ncbi:MAG: HD domain-containing protein [Treponema sp.]|nr:HD domain-containing protein [Treponema sp.]